MWLEKTIGRRIGAKGGLVTSGAHPLSFMICRTRRGPFLVAVEVEVVVVLHPESFGVDQRAVRHHLGTLLIWG